MLLYMLIARANVPITQSYIIHDYTNAVHYIFHFLYYFYITHYFIVTIHATITNVCNLILCTLPIYCTY